MKTISLNAQQFKSYQIVSLQVNAYEKKIGLP
jgi:hypothetical protein